MRMEGRRAWLTQVAVLNVEHAHVHNVFALSWRAKALLLLKFSFQAVWKYFDTPKRFADLKGPLGVRLPPLQIDRKYVCWAIWLGNPFSLWGSASGLA